MTRLRILLVEDDAMIGMLLAEMLEAIGHDVCAVATTEAAAITAAERHQPELMIIDARLAQGNGISAVEKILCSGYIPHFFLTGDISDVLRRRPKAVVLQKPFHEPELARAIERALGVSQL